MKVILAVLLLVCSLVAQARPNIVVIMVDDLDVQVWNAALTLEVLPNIKEHLIDNGTTFEQMFTSQPLCCPSRATFQTGQYSHNSNVVGNDGYYPAFKADMEDTALAMWLKEAGHDDGVYRTGFIGKYLNGSGNDALYTPPGWDVWQAFVMGTSYYCMYGYTMANTGGAPTVAGSEPHEYQTDMVTELAVDFIETKDVRPFFLSLNPTAPHAEGCLDGTPDIRTAPRYEGLTTTVALPTQASYNEDDVTDKPAWIQATAPLLPGKLAQHTNFFNAKIAAMRPVDDMVGRVFAALKAQNKLTNTVVMFISDNGYQYGTHRLKGKQDFYEESTRVPMVVRLPNQTFPYVQQSWILNTDWAVTIADFAGVTPLNTPDGRSFRPLLANHGTAGTRQTILMRANENPEDLTGVGGGTEGDDDGEHIPFLAVRTRDPALTLDGTGQTVLVYAETYDWDGTPAGTELYDLAVDPDQMTSFHASVIPDRVTQRGLLQTRMNALKTCIGGTCTTLENP